MVELVIKIKKHKVLFVNILFTFLSMFFNLLLGFKVLWFSLFILVPLFLNEEDSFSCLLYFSLFGRITHIKIFAVLICLYTFVFILKIIFTRLKANEFSKIPLYYFISIFLIFVYSLIVNKAITIQYAYYLNFINLISIFALIKHKFNKEMVLLYGYAIIISSLLSLVGYFLGLTNIPFAYEKKIDLLRFTGLCSNYNGLSICCVIEITLLFNLFFKGELPKFKTWFMIALLTIIGILTFSKTYFLTIVCTFLYIIICLFVKSKNKKKFVLYFLGLCVLVSPILIIYVSTILKRFTSFFTHSSFLDVITTGRYKYWKLYLKSFSKNIFTILFGVGACHNFNTEYSSHSLYVSLLSRLGVIGSLLILLFVIKTINHKKKSKFNFMNFFPLLLMILIFVVEDITFNTHNSIPFIISMLLLNHDDKKNQLK